MDQTKYTSVAMDKTYFFRTLGYWAGGLLAANRGSEACLVDYCKVVKQRLENYDPKVLTVVQRANIAMRYLHDQEPDERQMYHGQVGQEFPVEMSVKYIHIIALSVVEAEQELSGRY